VKMTNKLFDGPIEGILVISSDVLRLQETRYGCCDDGVTMAEGPRGEGCPFISQLCRDTQFGCCPDGVTAAEGKFPPASYKYYNYICWQQDIDILRLMSS